jgi:hypothetical protein
MQGGVPLEASTTSMACSQVLTPRQLLDGGLHFDDIDPPALCRRVRQNNSQADALHQELPRDFLHNLIDGANLTRPPVLRRVRPSS